MTRTQKNLVAGALIVLGIVVGLFIAYGMEKKNDFDRLMEAREQAPDKEEFDRNFEAMAQWLEDYKRDNPGATDEDASRAFDALWER